MMPYVYAMTPLNSLNLRNTLARIMKGLLGKVRLYSQRFYDPLQL